MALIDIKFTYHNIHPFKLYNVMISSIFRVVKPSLRMHFRTFSSIQKETLSATSHTPMFSCPLCFHFHHPSPQTTGM